VDSCLLASIFTSSLFVGSHLLASSVGSGSSKEKERARGKRKVTGEERWRLAPGWMRMKDDGRR